MPDNGGVYLVPAFAGLGAPHWDAYARGLDRRPHPRRDGERTSPAPRWRRSPSRAPTCWRRWKRTRGITLRELRVDGGAAANNLLMQFQADLLGVPVVRPKVLETTALGAGYLAGLAVGYWKDASDVAANWQVDRVFEPAMTRDHAGSLRANWHKAVARAKDWA